MQCLHLITLILILLFVLFDWKIHLLIWLFLSFFLSIHVNDELKERNKEIAILKGEFSSQITQIKESISKLLDEDTALGERIKTLFKEQGINHSFNTNSFRFYYFDNSRISNSGSTSAINSNNNNNNPNKKSNWVKDKLKALAGLLGKLGEKFAAALPGIIGSIVAWLFNTAKEVVSLLAENAWTLLVFLGGILLVFVRVSFKVKK